MIEYLESRTLNAVDPSSVTLPGYVEIAITKAGRLIIHGDARPQLIQVSLVFRDAAIAQMLANPLLELGHGGGGHHTVLLYSQDSGGFEQLSFAANTEPEQVKIASGALGELHENGDHVVIRDSLGFNLFIRSRFVTSLHFDMGAGDDVAIVNQDFGRSSVLLGGSGNDTLVSARGGDTIAGGRGNDRIVSRADNQMLIGGRGDDVFITRSTSQTIFAGAGRDSATQVGYSNEDGLEEFVAVETIQ